MITVVGATGHTGGVVAARLLDAGERVRVVSRSAERLAHWVARGAEPAAGDASDPEFVAMAFHGADAVYAMIPPDYAVADPIGRYEEYAEAIARGLEQSRVRRVVLLSSLGAHLPADTGPIVGLHHVEQRLAAVEGVERLYVRGAYFYENHLATLGLIKEQGIKADAVAPDVPVETIAAADIGAIAAEGLLAEGDFDGTRIWELVGPRPLSMREATRIIGARIGKPDLEYVQVPGDAYMLELIQGGFSPTGARLILEMAQAVSAARVVPQGEGTELRQGRITFEEFVGGALAEAYRAA